MHEMTELLRALQIQEKMVTSAAHKAANAALLFSQGKLSKEELSGYAKVFDMAVKARDQAETRYRKSGKEQ